MATNIEQIFRSFVVNKFKEIQEEEKLNSENSENSQNGELTAQKEENNSESTDVCLQSKGTAPTCQDETMTMENLELAKPVTALETDSASKELKSAEITSDDEVKRESSKKKSKKHKKHKSKKKKKKKKKEKHEKRSKSVSSVEDQENVSSETKSVWKPAFSSPPKEQGVLDALSSKAENANTVVFSSVNTQESIDSAEDKSTGLMLDVDSGFFGPKCPNELSKDVSSNSVTSDAAIKDIAIKEQYEASALSSQQSNVSTEHIEKTSEITKTQHSGLSLPIYSQAKSPGENRLLDVNSEKDSVHPSDRCGSLSRSKSNCEKLQKSKEKSRSKSRHRSRSMSLVKVSKSLETSTKSRQRSYSILRDQRKQSRSSSAGQRRRSASISPVRRQRSRSRTSARYSKSPIRSWWSKSIRNRRRSVSVVKRHRSRTRSPARRKSRSTEKRRCSRTRSRSPSRQRKSRSISRKYRQRSKSASNKRTRSKSAKRRQSKSGSVSRIRRSRSYSGSRRRKSRSGSVARRQRSWSGLAARRRASRSGSTARKQRSRSASAVKRHKSRSVSPARRHRSRSASPTRRRSRLTSPVRRRRSRSASPVRRRRSRSTSSVRRRRSRSASPARRRRSISASLSRRRRSRSTSPARRRRSRSASPARRRRSRSASPARRRRSRSASPARRQRSRSASPARRRRSRSASPARRRRSRSASPARRQRSSSVSRKRKSVDRRRSSSRSAVRRQRSRSGSDARRQSIRSTSAARKGSKSTSPSTARKPSQSKTRNKSRSRSGSVKLKRMSRSVEREHNVRSRSSSKGRPSPLAPLNERQLSISSTVKQTESASLSETIREESKLPQMTPESLCKAETVCLEKTNMPIKLIESSSENTTAIDSCSVSSVINQKILDSSFNASASNLSCTQFESSSQQDLHSSKYEMLTSANNFIEPYKPVDQTSLDCTETTYEKLQSSPEDSEILIDRVFQSPQKVRTVLPVELCDVIPKPDVVSVVEHEPANSGPEREETRATKDEDVCAVLEPTTCNQYSMDNELEFGHQALHSDHTSLEAEGKLSYLNSANNQYSCMIALSSSSAEAVQCSDWKHLESSNYQMSNDDGFKKHDSVLSPSTTAASFIEVPPDYSSTLTVQDTSASHSDECKIDLNLVHAPLQHASLSSHITSEAGVKPNPFLTTNNASLESSLNNQSEIQIRTLKGDVSECYSQVDTSSNCLLKHEDASTPNFGLSNKDKVVLQNSTEASLANLFAEQSYSIMSEQTCSEQTTKDNAYGDIAESFSTDNDFASHGIVDQNLASTYDEAGLLTSTEREHLIETEMHCINQKYPDVDLTQAEMQISQSRLGDELPASPQKTQSHDLFSSSQDQTNLIFQVPRQSPDPHVPRSFTDGTSSSRQVLESVQHGGLDQSLYSSSENIECVPATSNLYLMSSSADSGKELFAKTQKCNEISECIQIEKSCSNSEIHFNDDRNKVESTSASDNAEASTISVGLHDLKCVSDKEKRNLRSEAEQESASSVPGRKMCPEKCKIFSPKEMPSQKPQIFIQITDMLSKTAVEQKDSEINPSKEQYSVLLSNNNQSLDNIAEPNTVNTNEDRKDHGSATSLSRDSKNGNKLLAERHLGLEIDADNRTENKTTPSCTSLNATSLSVKQNSGSEMDVKPVTEEEGNTEPVSKINKKDNLEIDIESKTKNYGQISYASNTESAYLCSSTSEAQKISTSVHEMQKPPTAMPVQFKFSKTFKTLASSQLCNTSDESSDKEVSKVSSLSLSAKASASSYVESSRTSAKPPQKVSQLKLDTPLLPEALQPETLSNVRSDGKDVLQQDVDQTDDLQSSAAIKHTFPHISNALSKLGVKQRQYRSRSVAQDSRSPSMDRRHASRSRSKSTTRKRHSRSKSVSRKKRSQSSSRKKSSHSKSAKNKRSRSKSRGRKRRSQSKSKSKKKHSPSKSSVKRKRSRSKSSERVRSVGKTESSPSKSKTRRKGVQTKSPDVSRRSRSKSAVRKSSRTKNFDVRKASLSKSGSSRSRSRSVSISRRHLSHSKTSLTRKHSRSSSKSTSPRKRSLSRNKGHSLSRSPARRHRSRSRSHTRRHRSRSRGRWRRSLSSTRKRSRSSSRTSGTLSTKKRRSVSKSPIRSQQSRSQTKLKDKSPVTKRKSISPIPQKKTTQSKAAAFKHSIGLKSLIQKQLSQAKSQGSGGKLSKEQIPLSTIAARAQLPAAKFATRTQAYAPSLNTVSQMPVPNLAEVPLPSENGNGQIPVPSVPPEQQISVTSLAPEASLSVPDLTTATPWHVSDMASGTQWPVPDIAAGTQWSISDLTAGAQWPVADLAASSHWPMHDLGVGTQWSVPDLAAGTPWAVPDVATGAQWTVPDLTASTQWTVPDLTAGSQWAMTNLAPGTQWSVPDLAAAAQWTVPDLTSGTHIQSADLAPEAQVPGSDLASEAQVPGSDLATEAQVPGSDLTAEAQVPRSDLVSEAQVPVPDHIPDISDNDLVSEGHNLMPDVTAEALVPVASGTLVPDVAAGIPLPDVTAATQIPVPDVAATANMPVPDVATTAHSFMSSYASYSTVHESVFEKTPNQSVYLDMSLTAGELVDSSCVAESFVAKTLHSEALNRTEHETDLKSMPVTELCLPCELPLTYATVPEISASHSQEEIPVSSDYQLKRDHCSISSPPLLDPCLRSENSKLIESTANQSSSGISILFESHRNSECPLLPASDTDSTAVNSLHADSNPSLLHESCPSPMQSYISPNHTTLVDPYESPDNNLLIEPYSSPDRPILVSEYADSDCQLLTEPDAISDCSVLDSACASSDHSSIPYSHNHSHEEFSEHHASLDRLHQQEPSITLPCPEPADCFAKPNYPEQINTYVSPSCQSSGDRSADPDIPQLVEPYSSPEHPQLVEPYASPKHPQLVEPYASPECPQLVEPYASPEHPLLVEPYGSPDSQETVESDASQELPQVVQSFASPESAELVQSCASSECPQLVQPYDSPDQPQLDQPFAKQEQTQLVQTDSSPKSFNSPESPLVITSCANLQDPQLAQPYTSSEHKLDQPFANPEPINFETFANCEQQVFQSGTIPECPQVAQSFASSDCPQLVQPYDSPDHRQLVQPYVSPEHPQLEQSYGSPEHPHLVQPYDTSELPQLDKHYDTSGHPQLIQPSESPEHALLVQSYGSPEHLQQDQLCDRPEHPQLVLPFDSMECSQLGQLHATLEGSQLNQTYTSPKHSQLDQQYARPENLQLEKPHASPKDLQAEQPHASPKNKQVAQPDTSPELRQLVQPDHSQEHVQLVQPYDSPEHLQLVQPCASTEHPQLVESYASPEHTQVVEPYSIISHPQLAETYSSPYHSQHDKTNSTHDLSLNLESSCQDIKENCKITRSPQSDSRFDNSLLEKFDANTTGPLLELPCSSLQKQKHSPKLSQPILEECCETSYRISSEELYNTAHKSHLGDSSERPVHLVSKEDYIDSDQYLTGDCYSSDSTQLGKPISSSHHIELDESNNFHQQPLEKSLSGKKQLQLEVQYATDDQQLAKKLSLVEDCTISDQSQISENTNLEECSSSISCLNKDSLNTDQVLSVDLMNVSGQPLDEENSSSTDQLMKDTCLDFHHAAVHPQFSPVGTLDIPEQPSMPLLGRATSNADVSLTDRTVSSLDTRFEDRAVPSIDQEEQSDRFEEDKNLGTTEQHLTDDSKEIFECDPPEVLLAKTQVHLHKAYSSPDTLQQDEPLENYSYPHSENKSHRPSEPPQENPFMRAKERRPWDASDQTGLDADCSKNGQILSNTKIDDISELAETVEDSTSLMRSHLLSPDQICNKPLASILSADTKAPCTSLSLQTQDKVDNFISVQVSSLSVEFETHVAEDSGDKVQIDHDCKITPPDLLPFDSEQPTHMCLNSESSSEPVLFISQPPPELLPYDSEQPANPFQNISDYSSEQDSSVFHTPPELLPYDSDQTTMLISKPESCEEKQPFYEALDVSEKSVFSASENSSVSQVSLPSVGEETIKVQLSSEETDTSKISTKGLVCVAYEASRSSILTHASDLNYSDMLVEQPAATFLDVEFGQKLPSSQPSCDETKCILAEPCLSEITTSHNSSQREHSVEHSQLITEDSVKSAPPVYTAEIEQASLILNTCDTSGVQSCSGNIELVNISEQEKLTVTQSRIAVEVSNKRSRSKSLSKTELSHALSTSTKEDSPSKHASRSARSHSRSKGRKKSRSKSTTRKKRSRSKSGTRNKKSRSKSVVKTRKSRSKSATRRKKSRSVSDARFKRSRSRSISRKRRSRSTSVARKRSSRSPSTAHRKRSRSSRRKRSHSKSVDHKRSHSHSVARRRRSRSLSIARRRHSRSRSPVRRRSRSSSVHRRKRSRSSSVARRRRSHSSSVTRRRRSRSSSVSRRRHSPSQSITRRRRSPSLGRWRRSRSPSLAHRRRSRSASHRRRSRSPSASRRRRSPSVPRRRRSPSPSPARRKRSSSAARKRRSHSTSVTRKRHSRSSSASRKRRSRSSSVSHKRNSRTPSTAACKRRSDSKSPSPKSPKNKPGAQSKSDRSRSRSQSNIIRKRKTRSRSSSKDKSKSVEKRRKRSSSKEHFNIKQRRKSRTPPRRKKSRSPARRVSTCRSPVRRRRSRSPVRRKSFSRSPVRRKRSRSRDQSMDSARSPKRLTELDKAQLLEIAKANAAAMCAKAGVPLPPSLKPVLTPSAPVDEKVTHRTYGVTIQELTEKCKQIAQSKEDDEVVNKPHDSDEEEEDKPFYNHPFKVSDHKPISFSLLNPSLKPAPKNQVTLTKEFPVSSGSQHRKKESDKVYGEWVPVDKKTKESKDDVFTNTGPTQPVDITAAMTERAMAQTRLTGNPFDLEALIMLNRAQEQIDAWAQSSSLPGQFTGSTGAQVLSADEISNSGPQAWLKKDQFLKAAPVSGGRGALLMRKMGWKEGEGLGRHNEGNVNPILVDFKTDRKGLVADGEKASNKLTMPVIKDLSGKHPISVLMELCNKKKWSPPDFTLVDDTGPDHRKRFLFKVTVNGVTCQPSQPSVTKKLAKATAAAAALQALGALPKESITSTTNFCSASTSAV